MDSLSINFEQAVTEYLDLKYDIQRQKNETQILKQNIVSG